MRNEKFNINIPKADVFNKNWHPPIIDGNDFFNEMILDLYPEDIGRLVKLQLTNNSKPCEWWIADIKHHDEIGDRIVLLNSESLYTFEQASKLYDEQVKDFKDYITDRLNKSKEIGEENDIGLFYAYDFPKNFNLFKYNLPHNHCNPEVKAWVDKMGIDDSNSVNVSAPLKDGHKLLFAILVLYVSKDEWPSDNISARNNIFASCTEYKDIN